MNIIRLLKENSQSKVTCCMGCNAFESCREASAKQLIHMSTGSKTKIYVESTAAVDLRKHPAGHPVAGHCDALPYPNLPGRT